MLRIVTDGAADVPQGWHKEYDITVVPINIHFGEKTYLQSVDMDIDSFYKEVAVNKNFPKTSQPSPHQFMEFFKKNFEKGETILSLHVTSKLSGTYASCVSAAEELKGEYNIIPFDTACGSMGITFMCRTARVMANAGKSVDEIVARLKELIPQAHVIFTLDTLEYARRSGRVGTLSAALASVLNVKPIARLEDGVLRTVEKVRTRKGAVMRVMELGKATFGDQPVYVGVVHANDPQSRDLLIEEARKNFNVKDLQSSDLSVSLAINLGPGTVGLVLYPAE